MAKIILGLVILASVISCQNNSSSSGSPAKKENVVDKKVTPASCEQEWEMMLKYGVNGKFTKYEESKFTLKGNSKILKEKNINTTKIVSNDGIVIKFSEIIEDLVPEVKVSEHNFELNRQKYIDDCLGEVEDLNIKRTKVLIGSENIMVRSGNFNCTHTLETLISKEMNLEINSWTSTREPKIFIKVISKSNLVLQEGQTIPPGYEEYFAPQITETELIEANVWN